MKLKYEEKVIREINYHDLDAFISEAFGIKYECVAYEEWGNYQSHSFTVEREIVDEYLSQQLAAGIIPKYSTALFLNQACNLGLIEPGEYLVEVSW